MLNIVNLILVIVLSLIIVPLWSIMGLVANDEYLAQQPSRIGILLNHFQIDTCQRIEEIYSGLGELKTTLEIQFVSRADCRNGNVMNSWSQILRIEALHDRSVLNSILSMSTISLLLEPIYQTSSTRHSPLSDALAMIQQFDIIIAISCDNVESVGSDCGGSKAVYKLLQLMINVLPLHKRPAIMMFDFGVLPSESVDSTIGQLALAIVDCFMASKLCIQDYRQLRNESLTRLRSLYHAPIIEQSVSVEADFMARKHAASMVKNERHCTTCNLTISDRTVLDPIKICLKERRFCEYALTNRIERNLSLDSFKNVDLTPFDWSNYSETSGTHNGNRSVQLLCLTYTMSENHDRIADILSTWGSLCDGYLAFSNVSDYALSILTVNLPSYIIDERSEDYNQMWVKSQSIWHYIESTGLINHFDVFFLGGDDVYMIPDNLRWFVGSPALNSYLDKSAQYLGLPNSPLYLGRPIRANEYREFVSGGSGYVLNGASIRILNNALRINGDLRCLRELSASMEDLLVGSCLQHSGVEPYPYVMGLSRGNDRRSLPQVWLAQLFHPLSPAQAFEGSEEWYSRMALHIELGDRCCSPLSVSFQNIKAPNYSMHCLHQYLYG